MSPTAEYVTQSQLDTAVNGIQNRLDGLDSKIDQLLNGRTSEAFSMGQMTAKMDGMEKKIDAQATEIAIIKSELNKPKDAMMKLLFSLLKAAGVGLLGFALAKFKH